MFFIDIKLPPRRPVLKINTNEIRHLLRDCTWDFIFNGNDVSMAYETFLKKCLSTIEICTTKKASGDTRNSKQFKLPWFTDELKRAISLKNKLYKFHQVANTLKSLEDYKTHRNKLTRLLKNARAQYIAQKFSIYQSNSRKTWQLINQYVGKKSPRLPLLKKFKMLKVFLAMKTGT